MKSNRFVTYIFFIVCYFSCVSMGYCQGGIKLGFTGNINSMFSIYDFQSTDAMMLPRQNKYGWNLNGSINLTINDKFSIPFSFSIMNNQINAYYPIPNLKFFDRITHPSSIISFSPTFKWGSFYIGSHVPQVSKLIAGEVQIFGGGFDLNPGKFRIAASYGYAETAIQPDSLKSIRGSYRRHYNTIKAGIGKKDKSGIYLNFVKFKDEASSISLPAKILPPQEGIGVSSNVDIKFSDKLKFSIDGGGSIYTDNQFSDLADSTDIARIASFVIKPKKSSFIDLAGISSFSYNAGNFGLGINAQYIGAGFKTPGFPNRPSDVLDLTANTRFSLFKSKFNFNGITGVRRDNLSQTKISSNNSLLINAAINMMLTKFLTINTSYSNFGIERKEVNDSLNISTISSNIVVSPSLNFKTGTVCHLVNLGYNFNQSENLNLFTGVNNNNIITTYNLMYNVRVNTFNCSVSGFMAENNQNGIDILIKSLNILPSITILDKKLKIGVGFNYSNSLIGNEREDTRKTISLRTGYDFQNGIVLAMNGNLTSFDSERLATRSGFDESRVQMNINYTLGKSKSKEKGEQNKKDNKKESKTTEVPSNKEVVVAPEKGKKVEINTLDIDNDSKQKDKESVITPAVKPMNDSSSVNIKTQKVDTTSTKQNRNQNEITDNPISKDTSLTIVDSVFVKEILSLENTKKEADIQLTDNRDTVLVSEMKADDFKNVVDSINQIYASDTIVSIDTIDIRKDSISLKSKDWQTKPDSMTVVSPVKKDFVENIKVESPMNKVDAKSNPTEIPAEEKDNVDGDRYYIQLAATKTKIDVAKVYKQFAEKIELKSENGLYKYLIPCGSTYESALKYKTDLNTQGMKEGFIVRYKNDKRININD